VEPQLTLNKVVSTPGLDCREGDNFRFHDAAITLSGTNVTMADVSATWNAEATAFTTSGNEVLQVDATKTPPTLTLKASCRTVESEVWVVEGLLSLDAVIALPCGSKVGVEVDGPPHFFSNRPDVPTGDTVIKWRMLEKGVELGLLQGWVSVRDGSARELAKVEEAVRRLKEARGKACRVHGVCVREGRAAP
jgi:hypothetical protein